MSEPEPPQTKASTADLDSSQARLAYSIISDLLDHTRVVGDLVALMAQVIDEDAQEALTNTPVWTAYLDSRRALEQTRENVEKFTRVMNDLDPGEGPEDAAAQLP